MMVQNLRVKTVNMVNLQIFASTQVENLPIAALFAAAARNRKTLFIRKLVISCVTLNPSSVKLPLVSSTLDSAKQCLQ